MRARRDTKTSKPPGHGIFRQAVKYQIEKDRPLGKFGDGQTDFFGPKKGPRPLERSQSITRGKKDNSFGSRGVTPRYPSFGDLDGTNDMVVGRLSFVMAVGASLVMGQHGNQQMMQCSHARVPMPCLVAPVNIPVFSLHVPKTGGRTQTALVHQLSGLQTCPEFEGSVRRGFPEPGGHFVDYIHRGGNVTMPDFIRSLRRLAPFARAKPCVVSFEADWRAVTEGFGPSPPIVVTFTRDPTSWLISAIDHDRRRGLNDGVQDVYERGCLNASLPKKKSCLHKGYDYTRPRLLYALGTTPNEAIGRLETTLFGITEYFSASVCLLRYQFGLKVDSTCQACDHLHMQHADLHIGEALEADHMKQLEEEPPISHGAVSAMVELSENSPVAEFHARALMLFHERVHAAEEGTKFRLICH